MKDITANKTPPKDWKAYTPKKGDKIVKAPLLDVTFVVTKDPCPNPAYHTYTIREFSSGCILLSSRKKRSEAVAFVLADFNLNEAQRGKAKAKGGMLHPETIEKSRVSCWLHTQKETTQQL